ncbi:RHO guanyl-nucleotide exchange factor 12 [Perilla frutescens var. frutescens]|nr:RHO guanyl-nucleotide exchange factor 12 [Perilla frutescens var. frutescens]
MITRQRTDLHMNVLLDCLGNFKDQNEFYYEKGPRKNEKWWIPTPKVPPNGLSEVLTEMEIPESYIEALPKNGRPSLGDAMYKSITDDFFDPDVFLSSRKMNAKDSKSPWGSAVSMEKRVITEDRAETILLILKHGFPEIPQSDLDISKIQCNRDAGHAILESYSRIIKSLAFTVLQE